MPSVLRRLLRHLLTRFRMTGQLRDQDHSNVVTGAGQETIQLLNLVPDNLLVGILLVQDKSKVLPEIEAGPGTHLHLRKLQTHQQISKIRVKNLHLHFRKAAVVISLAPDLPEVRQGQTWTRTRRRALWTLISGKLPRKGNKCLLTKVVSQLSDMT